MDPGLIHWLGFTFKGKFYFDLVLTMGLRIACYICQRITNALIFVYRRLGYEGINYLDDLGVAEVARLACKAFDALGELLHNLGIWESETKASPPSTCMTFLGVDCDSEKFLLRVTNDRLEELRTLLDKWWTVKSVSLCETQSLVGKLNFVCYTVRSGRIFLARILNFLREFRGQSGRKTITKEICKDIFWWRTFLREFNGTTMFPETRWLLPDVVMSTDSSLIGCGGWSDGDYFHTQFPPAFKNNKDIAINKLECFAILLAVRLWSQRLCNKNILMYCDNMTTVEVVNKGKAHNHFTQSILRELIWWCIKCNCWIKLCHLTNQDNRLSDHLSRWHDDKHRKEFLQTTAGVHKQEYHVHDELFKFTHPW